jgi:hypothetical protein
MQTDGLFTVARFDVPKLRDKTCRIVFFGDIHRDSPNHAHGAWQHFLSYCKGLKDTIYCGMGDYLDSTSTSERACLLQSKDKLHETLSHDIEEIQQEKVELLTKELSFMRGNLIGMLGGNHYFAFQDGTSSDQRLCRALDCKYLGCSSFVRLVFAGHGGMVMSLDIWAHHGVGGGRLLGTSINRVDQMREHAEADVYAMGHDHKRGVVPATPRLFLSPARNGAMLVRQRQQWLVRSGSFLASYEDGKRNYNVDAARGPCSLGHVELLVTPARSAVGGRDENRLDIRGLA